MRISIVRSSRAAIVVAVVACGEEAAGPRGTPGRLEITREMDTVVVGTGKRIEATLLDASGSPRADGPAITWLSRTPAIVSVDSTGLARGHRMGAAWLLARAGTLQDSVLVEALRVASSLRIAQDRDSVPIGSWSTFARIVLQDREGVILGTPQRIAFMVTDPARGAVDSSGRVVVFGEAPVTVTATANGLTAQMTVRGYHAPSMLDGRGVVAVAPGTDHTCAVTGGGALHCYGGDGVGQLGDGPADNSNRGLTTVQVGQAFRGVASGPGFSCGIAQGGALYCWGRYDDPDGAPVFAPASRLPGIAVTRLDVSIPHTVCALAADSTAWCWGDNWLNRIGRDGPRMDTVPRQVHDGLRFRDLAIGYDHACGLDAAGQPWCWGRFMHADSFAVRVSSTRATPLAVPTALRFVRVTAGMEFTCGLTAVGEAWCWGRSQNRGLGSPGAPASPLPELVSGGHRFVDLQSFYDRTCGLTAEGELWCWGEGTEDIFPLTSPIGYRGVAHSPVRFSQHAIRAFGLSFWRTCAVTVGGRVLCLGG